MDGSAISHAEHDVACADAAVPGALGVFCRAVQKEPARYPVLFTSR